jgi:hypothetical protein
MKTILQFVLGAVVACFVYSCTARAQCACNQQVSLNSGIQQIPVRIEGTITFLPSPQPTNFQTLPGFIQGPVVTEIRQPIFFAPPASQNFNFDLRRGRGREHAFSFRSASR